MSNQTVLQKLKEKILDLEKEKISLKDFLQCFQLSIGALEGCSYKVIEESRNFEHKLQVCSYAEEENCLADTQEVLNSLKTWLADLEARGLL